MQIRQDLKYRALFGGNGINDDFDDEEDLADEWSQEDRPVNPDDFSRREVNARLRQYANGDRDWLFSF
jgi:hypothetical protein